MSDAGNFSNPPWQILKYDENGENPEVFIDQQLAWPQDILFLEDSNTVLISNLNSGRITRHDASTGDYINNFATGINGPTRMKIGPDSLLYVLQWNGGINAKVKRYQLDGTFVDDFTNIGITQSIGLDWDSEGNLYISSYAGDYVRKFDTAGVDQGNFVSPTQLEGPTNIWFDQNGELLVADYDGTGVKRFDENGTFMNTFINGLSNVEGVAIFEDGSILLGNGGTRSVKHYDSTGVYLGEFVSSGLGGLKTPNAVVIRSTMSLSIPDIEAQGSFILPTVERAFFLNPNYIGKIESLDIYSATGSQIGSMTGNGRDMWQAASFPRGIYFVVAYGLDGSRGTQKLILR